MQDDIVDRVQNHPQFKQLVAKRHRYSWMMAILGMIAYYGFILLVAFNKALLGTKIGAMTMTWGVPIGMGVIVFTIIITAIYVRRANSEFDDMNDALRRELKV